MEAEKNKTNKEMDEFVAGNARGILFLDVLLSLSLGAGLRGFFSDTI